MKNLKKIILLGMMLVNLMPYIKDGKLQCTITKVKGQNFGDECGTIDPWLPNHGGDMTNGFCPYFNTSPNSFDYGITGVVNPAREDSLTNNWCAFYTLSFLRPLMKPREYATAYHTTYGGDLYSGVAPSNLIPFYQANKVNFKQGVVDKCTLIEKLSTNSKGLLILPGGPVFVYFLFKRLDGEILENVTILSFNTDNTPFVNDETISDISLTSNSIVH
jgi:hypothetical protein